MPCIGSAIVQESGNMSLKSEVTTHNVTSGTSRQGEGRWEGHATIERSRLCTLDTGVDKTRAEPITHAPTQLEGAHNRERNELETSGLEAQELDHTLQCCGCSTRLQQGQFGLKICPSGTAIRVARRPSTRQ